MNEQLTKIRAASLLLERGVIYRIIDAPFLLRLLRLNRIKIVGLKAGTIAEFSLIIYSKQLDLMVADREYLNKELYSVCKTIAIAILNSKLKIRFLADRLANIFMWKIKYATLIDIFVTLVEMSSAVDFTSITSWMSQQTKMMMSPKMGQITEGG